jgi:hypothetical protein
MSSCPELSARPRQLGFRPIERNGGALQGAYCCVGRTHDRAGVLGFRPPGLGRRLGLNRCGKSSSHELCDADAALPGETGERALLVASHQDRQTLVSHRCRK